MYRAVWIVCVTALCGCLSARTEEASLKLYVFDCGRVGFDSPEARGFGFSNDATDVRECSAPCYMVEHTLGRLLWDGGVDSSIAESDEWQEQDGWRLRLDRTLKQQLAEMGLDMGSFDYAAFSHMHWDHVGVANELENVTLLIQEPEYRAAFAEETTVPGFNKDLYEGLKDADRILLNGEHDVFGDGRVRIIPAPGHTPGHQVLFLDLPDTGPIVLSGDLYHFPVSREQRAVPRWNVDAEQTLETMERIEQFVTNTGANLWIQHDLVWFEQLRKAPQYYK